MSENITYQIITQNYVCQEEQTRANKKNLLYIEIYIQRIESFYV